MAQETTPKNTVSNVTSTVLERFFADLAVVDGFEEVAARLKTVVLEKWNFAEVSIRAAIFDDDGS